MQPPWLSEVPFTLPFELFAHTGKLWIQNDGAATQDEFHIKGVNWAGFQVDGCPRLRRDRRTSGEISTDHVTTPPTPNSRLRRSRSRSPEPEPEPEPQPSPSLPVAEGSRSLDAETPAGGDADGAMDRSTI